MAERSIIVRLRAVTTDFRRDMDDASSAVQRNSQHINTLANGAGLLGAAMVGAAAIAIKKFADFDQSMSAVQAATHESTAAMGDLRDAALEAGARTKYSATEAASGIEELAKAGVSTADILGGGLNGSLSLAAAGAIGVGDAAEIAATAMTQFGLKGDQVSHVADLLAAGAGKAQGGVGDLGMALKQAGLVANSTGLTIEETTAGLAAFASAGLIGSDAGTSFKSMLQRLTPQSAEAQDAMDKLGISAYDSQGQFIGLAKFAGNLQTSLKDLTPEQRNAAEATIFGSDAVRAANILYTEGEKGIQDWTSAVDEQGYAAETAALRMDNLKGDIEQLSGSIETALIKTGEGANGPLRALVQSATDAVNAFGEMSGGAQTALLAIVGVGGLALLGGAGIAKLVVGINDAKVAMSAMGITAKSATLAVAGISVVLAVATIGIGAWASRQADAAAKVQSLSDSLDEATGKITDNTREIVKSALAAKNDDWWVLKKDPSAFDAAKTLGINLDTLTDAALGNADAMGKVNDKLSKFAGADPSHNDGSLAFQALIKAADDAGMSAYDYADQIGIVQDAIKGNSKSLAEAVEVAKQKQEADGESADKQRAVEAATKAATDAQEAATQALDEWTKMVTTADASFVGLDEAYQNVIDKNTEAATATADATKKSTDSWKDYYDGVSVSADEYIAQLQAQVDAQAAWESNLTDIAARTKTSMTGSMAEAAEGMINELLDLGPKGAAQVQLLHDMTDEQLAQVVTLWSQKGTSAVTDFAASLRAGMPGVPAIPVNADVAPAQASVFDLLVRTGNSGASVKIDADTSNATKTLQDFVTKAGQTAVGVGVRLPGHATGGAIQGPGTGTSDSILARLSDGEHVLTASDVQKAGGQGAVYAMRHAIQSGALRFAQSGPVYGTRVFAAAGQGYAQGGAVSASSTPSSQSARGGVTVNVASIVTTDANAAVNRLTTKMRDVVNTYSLAGVI